MPRAGHFRQADVTKAVMAARRAGMRVERFEIEPGGKITVVAVDPPAGAPRNEWDEELG